MMAHIPVLLEESLHYLRPKQGDKFIDATFGEGGHSLALWEMIKPNGEILAFEWDPELFQKGLERISSLKPMPKIKLVNKNFSEIERVVKEERFECVKGVIFDLGLSSYHYDEAKRGFAFKQNEFLDMRINPNDIKITAFEVVNYFSKSELIRILKNYGEEKRAEKIAEKIVEERKKKKLETTQELKELVSQVYKGRRGKIHPATKTFLALRTFINQELENLDKGLDGAINVLEKGGRIVIISFHGLEDKVVKEKIKKWKKEKRIVLITKNVVRPKKEEIKQNPRARSAKLRAIEKLNG
jgi:16S rRNA (cytosine1402-N4)-methyltransferase